MSRYESILGTVGRTPVVRITKLAPPHVRLYVKIEAFNPMGSVKDRLALGVIEAGERSGKLRPGQTVIEATSGNTGIGLAMVCAAKGYPLVVTMAENFSVERRRLMRFLGAKVVLTPAGLKGSGMLAKAVELAEAHGWFLCRQFENEANADMHSRTTAQEILADFRGDRLDYFVTGFGTGGTLKGVARVLREERPDTRIVVCEPDNSQLLGSGIAQPRSEDGAATVSHPMFRPHLMQGWTPDFIPKLAQDAVAMKLVDQTMPVNGGDALRLSRELAQKEGIFVGITAGATFAGALQLCESAPEGTTVLCMLPDTGERYLTTLLFADVPADMTPEEHAISRSTPNYRFDVAPPPAPPPPATGPQPIAADAVEFVDSVVNEPGSVVMFALEWCEFCWAVRKMFAHYKIAYRSVDLDSVEYQKDNRGGKIRAALTAKTAMPTIPQIFVAGTFIGGSTDLFAAWKNGRVQKLLSDAAIPYDAASTVDPISFLPTWLQPR
ncbi:MAG TPA: pyridoxal-phosphate dependent enzyme [Kofleriaceae bacterium]|nr:pyridoxal-phosphate dependent enzyme [Kofleriaceae bacterium]